MSGRIRRLSALVAAAALVAAFFQSAPQAVAQTSSPFATAQIRFELNATDGDLGIQVSLDGDAWRKVEIFRPGGHKMLEVRGVGRLRALGMTELFFESNEPSFDEVSMEEMLRMFPAGNYTVVGTTVDGEELRSRAKLTHDIPDGPEVVSPEEDETVDVDEVVVRWRPVTTPRGIVIAGYQVTVEGGTPPRVFDVRMPATATSVTVPVEFLERDTEYDLELLAIEVSGNQTITASSFQTR